MSRICVIFCTVLWILAAGQCAMAHPAHFSFADVDWNAESGCLEIALRMEAATLELALRRYAKTEARQLQEERLTLESPEAAQLVRKYVLERFEVKTAEGTKAAFNWIGSEVALIEAWAYFEVAVPDGPDGLKFKNEILFEEEPKQVNVVNLRAGDRGGTVYLTAQEPQKTIVLTDKAPRPNTEG